MEPLVRHYKAMERLFGAEVDGRLPLQSRAKVYTELQSMDLAAPYERVFGYGQFAVTVKGWRLTALGHLTYCMSCRDIQDESPDSAEESQ